MATQREVSKQDWKIDGVSPTIQEVNSGCLQRIAIATEAMAGNFLALQRENAELKNSRQYWIDRADVRDKTIINMKGQITKLKNKIQQLKEPTLQ